MTAANDPYIVHRNLGPDRPLLLLGRDDVGRFLADTPWGRQERARIDRLMQDVSSRINLSFPSLERPTYKQAKRRARRLGFRR
jgi:hypothetical protein